MLRVVSGGLTALVLCLSALGVPSAPSAAAAPPALSLSPAVPIVGETVEVRTRFATRVARPAQLQRNEAGRWRAVRNTRTTSAGAVSVDYRVTATAARLRVVAPAVRVNGRRYAPLASAVRNVVGTTQSVTFTPLRDAGGKVDLRVLVSHARPGRPVTVQSRAPGGAWTAVTKRQLGAGATVGLGDVATVAQLAGRQLRVVLSPQSGAPTLISATSEPPAVSATSELVDGDLEMTAATTGAVDALRFFVDGVLVAEDRTQPWAATWDARGGTHDVVVRALGPQGSVLTDAALVQVPAPPVGVDTGIVEGFALEAVQGGLELPTSAAPASGRVFVTEKAGTVQVLEPDTGGGYAVPREVLDLTAEVYDDSDAGLIGVAVDPDFADNGYVYLSFVRDDGVDDRRSQQVVRFTWDGDVLDPDSRHVVLGRVTGPDCSAQANISTADCVPLIGGAHTIGDLAFDPEGRLLVGVGDGSLYGNQGLAARPHTLRAQDPAVLAGKVLRIDPVTGRGVPDNPLYSGDGSSNASRVLALGFRNPFRFTLHDGVLVVGDVGESAWEEVDTLHLEDLGEEPPNFGWPCLEGQGPTSLGDVSDPGSPWHTCQAVRAEGATEAPAHVYSHAGPGGSISGGAFLDDVSYPDGWRGQYVFGDYARNRIWTADVSDHGEVSGVSDFASSAGADRPVKFFTGPDGLVWTVAIGSGSLRRLRYLGTTAPDQCDLGTFRRTFHDLDGPDSAFDREYPDDEYRWLFPYAAAHPPEEALAAPTCEEGVTLPATSGSPWATEEEPDERAHPGDRFATVWNGRVDVEAGTYRFVVLGSEWMRVWVDDVEVHDFYANEFWSTDIREHDLPLSRGQHTIRVEHIHGDEDVARASVTWSRVGGPPTVVLTAPANGYLTSGTVPWQVEVGDPDGDDPADLAETVELAVDFLHYAGDDYHAHPMARFDGQLSGTLTVDDVHAPGAGVVRLRATVTDASGGTTTSTPVYVCFPGGDVGPCAQE